MKKKNKLSLKRVFMFAILLLIISLFGTTISSEDSNLLAVEDTPYYEGKYYNVNFVANLLDEIGKDNILISPFNINSTLAALYNLDNNLNSYFQDPLDNVNNNYMSKMTKYKKNIKKKTKKELFYEKKIADFYTKQYNTINIKSLSKMGTNEKKELITLIDTIFLAQESLSNKNISLKQLEKYKPRENVYNINNQTIYDKINTIILDYNLYNQKNYITNISNLYYNQDLKKLDVKLLNDKYLINTKALDFDNIKDINKDIYTESNKQVNYIVDDKDLNSNSLITSSFVFNYKWETIIERSKNTYEDYYIEDQIISAEMLNFTSTNYLENKTAQGFIKDYENNKYSFVGILPKQNNELSSINLDNLLKSRVDITTNITIPKFSLIDTNNIMSLKDINSIYLSKDLKLDNYYQKNIFNFGEAGTYELDSKYMNSNNIATLSSVDNIVFNHPFYFMVVDNENNSVLLAGKITNPNN